MSGPETVFGGELRRLRSVAGLSQSALTARIHYSKSHVSKVENGHASANRPFAEACDRALGTDGVLAALLAAQPAPPAGFSGLPTATRHFVGRADVLGQVRAVLLGPSGGTSVCVLTGMAGAGKTAVALRAAWDSETEFPDGCLFFDLHGYTPDSAEISSDEAMDRILRVLGVPDVPADPDGRANTYRDRLRGRRMLLVFDNVRTARQVGPLLPVEPRSRVLITSRNRLNALDDAAHVSVEELSTVESVALFRAVAGDRVADSEDAVLDVVGHCGRLPLALRIAAARFRSSPMWTMSDLAERLADHAARLTTLDDGERSIAAAFTLSCQELPTDQLRLFALLALHPGHDIGLRTAAVLGGLGLAEAENLLIRLDDAHLVSLRHGGRVRLHDLVRSFAINHALPALPLDDRAAAADRLLDHMVSQTAAGDAVLSPRRYRPAFSLADPAPGIAAFTDQDAAMAWLDRELPTLVALVATAAAREDRRCWQLAFLLRDYFFRAKQWDAWIETHRHAATYARAVDDRAALALTLNNLGMAHLERHELDTASDHFRQALDLFAATSDEHGTVNARANLAWVTHYLGDHQSALTDMAAAYEFYVRTGCARNAAICLRGMALAEIELGSTDDALCHAEQALDSATEDLDEAMSLNCLGWVLYQAGRANQASAYYRRAVEAGERCGSHYEYARALTGLGNVATITGDPETATRRWTEAAEAHALAPAMAGEARARAALA